MCAPSTYSSSWERKITALPRIHDEMYEQLRVNMGIDSDYVRPSGSYTRANFRCTFRNTSSSILLGQ
ncbi:MAG: hypothetical protein ACKPKO_08835, partial [Candidatus Fonsibacter sp.]